MRLLGLKDPAHPAGSRGRKQTFPTPSLETVDPTSQSALKKRLATFKIASYSEKPQAIDTLAAARHGWSNMKQGERERLFCEACKALWKVPGTLASC